MILSAADASKLLNVFVQGGLDRLNLQLERVGEAHPEVMELRGRRNFYFSGDLLHWAMKRDVIVLH